METKIISITKTGNGYKVLYKPYGIDYVNEDQAIEYSKMFKIKIK